MSTGTLPSPLGRVTITAEDGAVTALSWSRLGIDGEAGQAAPADPVLAGAIAQLTAYFAGDRAAFDLPLRVDGSDLQQQVCAAMAAIPFGETRTYGDIANDLGVPAQAIGQACGGNPIPIIIPCHRVLGVDGLGGFSGSGGIEAKVWLLKHEGAASLLI
ncbi:Methylated-DNA--protein-cysteine methyltransferase [Candidatus Rhodobacter oscarellae]|uniref:Methylated-DNA--protein-cysteine methyltransferase n=1 Tax=Candidatus Rhodobacter oscarellae TaxID=1675527 RepID=A0A0J9E3Q3_9RHOB|nr:methylated-DNA--[protein]-cysteine S-methyltransferase [Candidatus Rhodobacter lobularis]KMW56459.1 Methylated-DNA--protein-cysteine methyltransferase [Candidatus Rhodobacter lobularis]